MAYIRSNTKYLHALKSSIVMRATKGKQAFQKMGHGNSHCTSFLLGWNNNAFFSFRTVKTPVQPDNIKLNFLPAYTDMKLIHQDHPSPSRSFLSRTGWDAVYRWVHPAVPVDSWLLLLLPGHWFPGWRHTTLPDLQHQAEIVLWMQRNPE